MLQRWWTLACCRIGYRGATLLWLAFLDLVFGMSLAFPAPQAGRSANNRWMADIAPLPCWGALWLLVAVILVVGAFRRRDQLAYGAAVTIKVLWSLLSIAGWLFGGVERGWVGAAFFVVFAGWAALESRRPEPPALLRLNEDMTVRGD